MLQQKRYRIVLKEICIALLKLFQPNMNKCVALGASSLLTIFRTPSYHCVFRIALDGVRLPEKYKLQVIKDTSV